MNNDLISRDYVSNKICDLYSDGEKANKKDRTINEVMDIIDNAPTVEPEKALIANVAFDEDKLKEIVKTEVIDKIKSGELVLNDERPQGKWDYEQVALYGVCSNCGATVTSNLADIFLYEEIGKCPYNTNFCPNCGADMRKEDKK